MLLSHKHISTEDAVLVLRRLIHNIAYPPQIIQSQRDVASMIASKQMLQIFDVEAIIVFLAPYTTSASLEIWHKYTSSSSSSSTDVPALGPRRGSTLGATGAEADGSVASSSRPSSPVREVSYETYNSTQHTCLAFDTIKYDKIHKYNTYNDLQSTAYHPTLDGPGSGQSLPVSSVLSLPIRHPHTGAVIGVIQMLNKHNQGKGFTEYDELFASIYASLCAFTLDTIAVKTQLFDHTQLLTRMLQVQSGLARLIEEKQKSAATLSPTDHLAVIERVCEKTLNIGQVKAFLSSEQFDMGEGSIVYLESKKSSLQRFANGSYLKALKRGVGLIGGALERGAVVWTDALESDALVHGEVLLMN